MTSRDPDEDRFGYRVHKDGLVRIFWRGRCVLSLGGERGARLAADLETADEDRAQALLQRVTGNFKRGNERQGKGR